MRTVAPKSVDEYLTVVPEPARSTLSKVCEAVSAEEIAKVSGPLLALPPVKAKGSITGQVLDGVSGAPRNGVALRPPFWPATSPK